MKPFLKPAILYLGAFVLLIFVLGTSGPWVNTWLAWNREALDQWQWWRLLSGHLVHTNLWHTVINLAVLIVAMLLYGSGFRPRTWLLFFSVLCVCNSLALYFFSPWLQNYVGLSGVLYGVLALGLLAGLRAQPLVNTVVLLIIAGKIVYEQLPGFDVNYLRAQIGTAVIVDAHLYGFISGVILYLFAWLMKMEKYPFGK